MANERGQGAAGRLIAEHISKRAQWLDRHPDAGSITLGKLATTLAEIAPIPLDVIFPPLLAIPIVNVFAAVYCVGDLVTAGEAIIGRTLDGRPLSIFERVVIYGGASVTPYAPARPVIMAWDHWQEKHLDPLIRQRQAARRS